MLLVLRRIPMTEPPTSAITKTARGQYSTGDDTLPVTVLLAGKKSCLCPKNLSRIDVADVTAAAARATSVETTIDTVGDADRPTSIAIEKPVSAAGTI